MNGETPYWITAGYWDFELRTKIQDPPLWDAIEELLEKLAESHDWLAWWARQTPLPLTLYWGIEQGSQPGRRRQHSSRSYVAVTSILGDSETFDLDESQVLACAASEVEAAIDYVVARRGLEPHPPWPWSGGSGVMVDGRLDGAV